MQGQQQQFAALDPSLDAELKELERLEAERERLDAQRKAKLEQLRSGTNAQRILEAKKPALLRAYAARTESMNRHLEADKAVQQAVEKVAALIRAINAEARPTLDKLREEREAAMKALVGADNAVDQLEEPLRKLGFTKSDFPQVK